MQKSSLSVAKYNLPTYSLIPCEPPSSLVPLALFKDHFLSPHDTLLMRIFILHSSGSPTQPITPQADPVRRAPAIGCKAFATPSVLKTGVVGGFLPIMRAGAGCASDTEALRR
ncbi:hypothetical protein DPX16_20602 [Anabarilius grahami]|uniref:Uncharacterized protein n=1 Tax=Anabarilius grahami TaxID=495550 RepID=A0A3N0YM18_ANAGA|nr:hypothetical protein DPX16_20602 [Anabarilius grahami]